MPQQLRLVSAKNIPEAKSVRITNEKILNNLYLIAIEMAKLCEKLDGVGLHAVQVNIQHRLFIVKYKDPKTGDEVYNPFVNGWYEPIYGVSKSYSIIEGCLSLPDQYYRVNRWDKIYFEGGLLLQKGKKIVLKQIEGEFEGEYAQRLAHECDHGDGILISHIGQKVELIEDQS